jgi:succinyl-CoA:acetate CoA-transferase
VPLALAGRIEAAQAVAKFALRVLTGASTAPELDGALAKAGGIDFRLPYQSDPELRARINRGEIDYMDVHLGQVAQYTWFGFLGKIDLAVVEVAGILPDGRLIPSTSIGNNKTWLDLADKVILEVNSTQPLGLDGMHDIYYGTALPPNRQPIPLTQAGDRIGEPYLRWTRPRWLPWWKPMRRTAWALHAAGRNQPAHCRTSGGIPQARNQDGPSAGKPAALAVWRGQYRQCGAGRPA